MNHQNQLYSNQEVATIGSATVDTTSNTTTSDTTAADTTQIINQLWEQLNKKEEELKNIMEDYKRKQATVKKLNIQIKKEKNRWANHINASTTGHCHQLVRNKELRARVRYLRILKNTSDNQKDFTNM